MYDGREIANYVLDYADENGITVTNMSLQKIVYFCHVWFLVFTRKPLVRHKFEAWDFGPVLPYLYRFFSKFSDAALTNRATKIDPETGELIAAKLNISREDEKLLKEIVIFYSRLSARQLVELSHIRNGPWHKAWNYESIINPGMHISDEDILNFYTSDQQPYNLQ
ncbi:MAG: type II toxin-antitoxin system antitoxin SocA domain-containing protein [Candidatus Thiodiazotropha lotti]